MPQDILKKGTKNDFATVRYKTNGIIDSTFGKNGIVITAIGVSTDNANDAAIQTDGKIIVAGTSRVTGIDNIALARYTAEGLLNTAFGNNGIVITQIGTDISVANSVELQDDGNIIVTGYFTDSTGYLSFLALRYLNDELMPIELTSLTAQEINNGVTLNWTTATEINNLGYEVQRSHPQPLPKGKGHKSQ